MAAIDQQPVQLTSLEVATESTYGSVLSTTGSPSTSGLTFKALEVAERASIVPTGDPALIERMDPRCGMYDLPPEPATIDEEHRNSAKLSVEMPIRTIGAALAAGGGSAGTEYDDYTEMPMWELANTALQSGIHPTKERDEVTGQQSVNRHETTTIANFETGSMFKTIINGRSEFSGVTSLVAVGAEAWYSPALSAAIDTPAQVLPMSQLYIPQCGKPDTISCAVRMNGYGWKGVGYGATADAVRWMYSAENRRLSFGVDLDIPDIIYERTSPNEVVSVDYAAGHHQYHLKAYLVITDADYTTLQSPATAPAEYARHTYCLDEMECVMTLTREAAGCGESIIGQAGYPINDISTEMTLTISGTNDDFDDDLWKDGGRMKSVLVGFSSGDPTAQGECSCLYMPAAVLQNNPQILDNGKGFWRTTLVYRAGPWSGDLDPGSQGDPNNSVFRWALGEAYDPSV